MSDSKAITDGAGGRNPAISVVVPVRNEAGNILPLIGEIRAALEGVEPFEIVYIDDGSSDETPARLREAVADGAPLRILHHRVSCGQSAAVASGVRAAMGAIIATLDGDGQNDPADIPALLERYRAEAAMAGEAGVMVCGWRVKRKDTLIKRLSSRFANKLRQALLGDATPDTGCGLKVFPRSAFLDMPRFDHMHRFLPALMIRRGGRVVSVPVNHRPRERGRSNYGTLDRAWASIWDLMGVIWLKQRGKRPEVSDVTDRPGDPGA